MYTADLVNIILLRLFKYILLQLLRLSKVRWTGTIRVASQGQLAPVDSFKWNGMASTLPRQNCRNSSTFFHCHLWQRAACNSEGIECRQYKGISKLTRNLKLQTYSIGIYHVARNFSSHKFGWANQPTTKLKFPNIRVSYYYTLGV